MRINLNFHYDKLHLKEIIILIPKYHTNMVSFLTPILGLYGINVKEFINDFDIKTKFINFDVIIPTIVKISKIKTFEIVLKTPYVISILSNLPGFSVTKPNIDILSIYKVSLLKAIFYSNFLNVFHKKIYFSLRKYLSLVMKINFHLSVSPSFVKKKEVSLNNLYLLKFGIQLNKLLIRLAHNNYGLFINFSNSSASRLNYLKVALAIQNISIFKIKSKFLSSLINNRYFFGNTYFIGSTSLSYFINFFKEISVKSFVSNFFPTFFRIRANLLTQTFARLFILAFNSKIKVIKFQLLKAIYTVSVKILNFLNFLNKKLLFLLNQNYNANIPSNIKKS